MKGRTFSISVPWATSGKLFTAGFKIGRKISLRGLNSWAILANAGSTSSGADISTGHRLRLAQLGQARPRAHIRPMTKVWKIISSTPRMGGGGPPLRQYFLVATSNQSAALRALRYRRPDVEASQLIVAGETNTDNLEWQWLDLQEGQILVLEAVS
jgi:hypothetical protein